MAWLAAIDKLYELRKELEFNKVSERKIDKKLYLQKIKHS